MEVSHLILLSIQYLNSLSLRGSAFETVPVHQFPPHRRITQDEAPSMMPLPAQNTSHQGGAGGAGGHNGGGHVGGPFGQPHSKPGSTTSFASVSVSGGYAGQTTTTGGNGHSRKKARLG